MHYPALCLLASAFPLALGASAHQRRGNQSHRELARRANGDLLDKRAEFNGARWTFYSTGLGACGGTNSDSDFIVALNQETFGFSYPSQYCNKKITMTYNGKTTTATIVDSCPGCPSPGGLDLSPGLFSFFADQSVGVINGDWSFVDDSEPNPTTSTTQKKTTTAAPPPPVTTTTHTTPHTTTTEAKPTTSTAAPAAPKETTTAKPTTEAKPTTTPAAPKETTTTEAKPTTSTPTPAAPKETTSTEAKETTSTAVPAAPKETTTTTEAKPTTSTSAPAAPKETTSTEAKETTSTAAPETPKETTTAKATTEAKPTTTETPTSSIVHATPASSLVKAASPSVAKAASSPVVPVAPSSAAAAVPTTTPAVVGNVETQPDSDSAPTSSADSASVNGGLGEGTGGAAALGFSSALMGALVLAVAAVLA